mmetsp:Transcript_7800/g.14166  ORF Transcript_7800/g.14166 Transcript_7800/m.14166 type:complete len:91 (-) Transcript_7800:300-572(-)
MVEIIENENVLHSKAVVEGPGLALLPESIVKRVVKRTADSVCNERNKKVNKSTMKQKTKPQTQSRILIQPEASRAINISTSIFINYIMAT